MTLVLAEEPPKGPSRGAIKCLVWDLDDTLWSGNLLEDAAVQLRPGVRRIVQALDERGILQSIASRNEYDGAITALRRFDLNEYFLYPQINWNAKSSSILAIAKALNIGVDSIAFLDDQAFERAEVAAAVPGVLCIDAAELDGLLDREELTPRFVTEDSRLRRRMYLSDMARRDAEEKFVGPTDAFLATLGMRFTIAPTTEDDLMRAEELTVRTNQLNTTGYTYSYDELNALRRSKEYTLLVTSLEDRYGTYGKIGLSLIRLGSRVWTIKLLLMSCRVMSRGAGMILINYIKGLARRANVSLRAEFVPTGRNRMIYITFRLAGFREVDQSDKVHILECDLDEVPSFPDYVKVHVTEEDR